MRCTILILTCLSVTLLSGCAAPPAPLRSVVPSSRPLEQKVMAQQRQLVDLDATVQQLATALATTQNELTSLRREVSLLKTPLQNEQSVPAVTTTSDTGSRQPSATDTYLQAFSAYTAADYSAATSGFNTFIQRYPRNPYIPNAYFWNGEALLAQNNLEQAVEAFSAVVKEYPEAHKAPDALVKLAQIYAQLGQTSQAQQLLHQLELKYPKSSARKRIPQTLLDTLAQ
ncbi:MAG: tol-pal system protein YbgF [Deltaproteobacteria bacterium]|nr:tol-pal system protein YbgF [Deltaproteobacteria bacterium]